MVVDVFNENRHICGVVQRWTTTICRDDKQVIVSNVSGELTACRDLTTDGVDLKQVRAVAETGVDGVRDASVLIDISVFGGN